MRTKIKLFQFKFYNWALFGKISLLSFVAILKLGSQQKNWVQALKKNWSNMLIFRARVIPLTGSTGDLLTEVAKCPTKERSIA